MASFGGLTGRNVYTNSDGEPVVEPGTLFFFRKTAGDENAYPLIFVRGSAPAEDGRRRCAPGQDQHLGHGRAGGCPLQVLTPDRGHVQSVLSPASPAYSRMTRRALSMYSSGRPHSLAPSITILS